MKGVLKMAKAREKLISDLLTKLSGVCKANGGIDSVGIDYAGDAIPGKQIPPNTLENLHTGEFFFRIKDTYMDALREVFDSNTVKEYVFYPISDQKTELFSTPEIPTLEPIPDQTKESLHHNIDVMNKFLSQFKEEDWKPFVTEEREEEVSDLLFEKSGAMEFYPSEDSGYILLSSALFPKLTKNNLKDLSFVYYRPSETMNLGGCVFKLAHTHFDLYIMFCFVPMLGTKQ